MKHKLNKLGVENSLWNNIRANKGSGKKPTKQMLEQEAKIKAKYPDGGIKLKFDSSQNEIDPKTGQPTGRGGLEDASWEALQAITGAAALGKAGKLAYDAYKLSKPGIINLSKTYYPTYNKALKEVGKALLPFANGGKVDDFNYDRWRRSLPENLQQESPNYNLRGYWESLNKPDLFNPFEHDLNEDGAYHASSRDPRTGEILKGKLHPTLNLALKDVDDQGNVYTPYMKNRKIYTHTYDSQGNEQYGNGGKLNKEIDMKYGKGGSIHIKPENKGKFTSWAKSHGMGVQEAASHVMANKDKYSSTIVKRANFAKNASKWHHALGGMAKYPGGGETEPEVPVNPITTPTWDPNSESMPKYLYNTRIENGKTTYTMADQETQDKYNKGLIQPEWFQMGIGERRNPVSAPKLAPITNPVAPIKPSVPREMYGDASSYNVPTAPKVATNNNRLYQGREFMESTGLNPGNYSEAQVAQARAAKMASRAKPVGMPMVSTTTPTLPVNAMGGYVPKYSYVNGKFIPTHGFGDTTVGAGIKEGGAIAPTLGLAGAFVGDNNSPLGQALDYGAQGASAGMMFGPWGAAIGGGLGLAGGAIKGYMDQEEQARKQREYEQQKKNASTYAQLMGRGPQSNLSVKTNNQALYAAGGMKVISRNHPNPQEEVEGGETAITPNGKNIQFRGPKHNNGGIKTNLPAGTRIFSDRIVYPG